MKFHLMSDLHLEHAAMRRVPDIGDVLLLPGDITTAYKLDLVLEVAHNYLVVGKPVLMVPGNHEFYGWVLPTALRTIHRTLRAEGITLLHNRMVDLGGVRVFGATMWTDYLLNGEEAQAHQMKMAMAKMHDHRAIGMPADMGDRYFTAEDALRMNQKSLRMLRTALSKPYTGKSLVMTHHGVHPKSIDAKYANDPCNSAFVSDLSDIVEEFAPDVMVHGHSHASARYTLESRQLGRTTLVQSNPRGYPLNPSFYTPDPPKFENPKFNPKLTLEV